MADRDVLAALAEELGRAFGPLELALQSQDDFSDAHARARLGPRHDPRRARVAAGAPRDDRDSCSTAASSTRTACPARCTRISSALGAVDRIANATGLPGTVDAGAFTAELPRQLVDYLAGRVPARLPTASSATC